MKIIATDKAPAICYNSSRTAGTAVREEKI